MGILGVAAASQGKVESIDGHHWSSVAKLPATLSIFHLEGHCCNALGSSWSTAAPLQQDFGLCDLEGLFRPERFCDL